MAAALITFDVEPDGGEPFELPATSRDLARWERMGKANTMARFETNPTIADLEAVAFIALERSVAAGRLEYPPGVTDLPTFRELCDIKPRDSDDSDDEGSGGLDPTHRGR